MRRPMLRIATVASLAWMLGGGSLAWAVDTVKLIEGKPMVGTVNAMSPTEITLQQGALPSKIAVNEIATRLTPRHNLDI